MQTSEDANVLTLAVTQTEPSSIYRRVPVVAFVSPITLFGATVHAHLQSHTSSKPTHRKQLHEHSIYSESHLSCRDFCVMRGDEVEKAE